jgi:tRNA-dihydrouridine synthase B
MQIKDLHISPPLFLAPMAGVTHSGLRTIIKECGGVGLLSTEMLSARRLPNENATLSPLLLKSPIETPMSYQMLVSDPADIPAAMEALHRFGAQAVDLNLGCPAPAVRRQGAGSKLSEDLDLVRKVVSTARAATDLPLSAKIRIGPELNKEKLQNFCRMLAGEGIDYLIVHGRLQKEKFCRPPRWEWIRVAKEAVDIPVIANGGIFTVADARQCLDITGADGLMLGRAAPQKPWLFAEIHHQLYGGPVPPPVNKPALYKRFIDIIEATFPEGRQIGRTKEFSHYFSRNYSFGHHLGSRVQSCTSMAQVHVVARGFFMQQEPEMCAQAWPLNLPAKHGNDK